MWSNFQSIRFVNEHVRIFGRRRKLRTRMCAGGSEICMAAYSFHGLKGWRSEGSFFVALLLAMLCSYLVSDTWSLPSLSRSTYQQKNSNPNPNPVRNPVRLLQNARVSANQKSSPIRCQNLHQIRDLPSRNFQPATYATYLVQVFTSEHWKFLIGWKTATLTLTLNPLRLLKNAWLSANQRSAPSRYQNLHQIRDLPLPAPPPTPSGENRRGRWASKKKRGKRTEVCLKLWKRDRLCDANASCSLETLRIWVKSRPC